MHKDASIMDIERPHTHSFCVVVENTYKANISIKTCDEETKGLRSNKFPNAKVASVKNILNF